MASQSKIVKYIGMFFDLTDNLRLKIYSTNNFLQNNFAIWLVFVFIDMTAIFITLYCKCQILADVFIFLLFLLFYFNRISQMLYSLRQFIKTSIILCILISAMILTLIELVTDNLLLQYILLNIIICLVWSFISLLAETKISLLVNEIQSIILSVILIIKDGAFDLIEYMINTDISRITYVTIDSILIPLLLINGFATIICMLKNYWNEKKCQN